MIADEFNFTNSRYIDGYESINLIYLFIQFHNFHFVTYKPSLPLCTRPHLLFQQDAYDQHYFINEYLIPHGLA